MELVQGVVLRYRVEGQEAVEKSADTLDRTAKSGQAAGQGAAQAAEGLKKTGAAAREADAPLSAVQGHFDKLMKWALPAGIVAGIALVGKRAIDTADQMAQLSKRTGASVEDMSRLSYAAKLADTDMTAVSTGFKIMARTATDAAEGNKDLQKSFATVGVSLEDLRSKDPTQLFLAIANGVMAIPDPTLRAAKAQELLGRSATELLPLMQDLAGEGFAKVSAEAEQLGMVISTQTANAAEELNDNLDRLKGAGSGLALTVLREIVPALVTLTATLDDVSTSANTSRQDLDEWTTYLTSVAPLLTATAAGFREIVAGMVAIAKTAAMGVPTLNNLTASAEERKKELLAIWSDYAKQIEQIGDRAADALLGKHDTSTPGKSGAGAATGQFGPYISPERAAMLEAQEKAADKMAAAEERAAKAARAHREAYVEIKGVTDSWIPYLTTEVNAAINLATLAGALAKARGADRVQSGMAKLWDDAGKSIGPVMLDSTKAVAPQISLELARAMRLSLGDALADVAQTGGKNLGEIAGRMFSSMVTEGADSIIQSFSVGAAKLFGDKITQKDGKWYLNGKEVGSFDEAMAGSKASRVIAGGQAVLGAGLTGYQTGQAGEGGRTAGAVSGLMAGAATGNPFIAIGAMIAGYIGGILGEQQRQADYKYGIPRFVNGVASLGDTKNINPAERQQMEAQLQSVFTSTWNQFTRILLTLPGASMPSMPASFGEAFQDNPSGKYMKHFDEYLKNTLPREIAELFKSGMEDAFVGSGVTKEAFARFWKEAEGLDAATRGQFWSDLAEGLAALSRAQANMAAVRSNWTESDQFGSVRMGRFQFTNGRVMETGESKFEADIRNAGEGLFRIGREMVNLTGPERVAAFKALGQGIEAVTLSLQAYIEQIGDTIRGLARTFADERLTKELERAGSPKDQAAILWANYNANLGAIGMMKDPAEIERLTRRNVEILNQIYALDPSAEMYEWWKRQMSTLEMISTSSLEKLAAAATSKVDAVLASVKPFTDWMMGLPVNLQPAWAALDTGIRGAADALRDLEAAIRNATNPAPGNGGGNPGGGGPGGGGNDAGATSLVINMNGSYTDREALRRDVVAAVRSAVSTNPNLLDGAF